MGQRESSRKSKKKMRQLDRDIERTWQEYEERKDLVTGIERGRALWRKYERKMQKLGDRRSREMRNQADLERRQRALNAGLEMCFDLGLSYF
jgi:hypothetical protein